MHCPRSIFNFAILHCFQIWTPPHPRTIAPMASRMAVIGARKCARHLCQDAVLDGSSWSQQGVLESQKSADSSPSKQHSGVFLCNKAKEAAVFACRMAFTTLFLVVLGSFAMSSALFSSDPTCSVESCLESLTPSFPVFPTVRNPVRDA